MARIVTGTIAGSALTGSFQDVIASTAFLDASGGSAVRCLIITSDLDQACLISLGCSGQPMRLPAGGAGLVLDCRAFNFGITDAIQAKHDGVASSAGTKLNITAFMDS